MTKLNIQAVAKSPDYYTISGETVTAYHGDVSETYDLSVFPEGGVFQEADPVDGIPAIQNVKRVDGELFITLYQQVGPGHWSESGWIDASDYDPDAIHVVKDTSREYVGTAWAKTRQGKEKG